MTSLTLHFDRRIGVAALMWLAVTGPLHAQPADTAQAAAPTPAVTAARAHATPAWQPLETQVQVGDATQTLLALQRDGTHASTTRHRVIGEVAQRTYTRYLDSFKHPIPESFDAAVRTGGSASGAGSSGGLR